VPGIALTGFSSKVDQPKTMAAGFALRLIKPVDLDMLTASMRALVGASEAAEDVTADSTADSTTDCTFGSDNAGGLRQARSCAAALQPDAG
jgi:DNA-binding response OmpR family regulator